VRFDGFKELCFLHPKYFQPDPSVFDELGIQYAQKYFLIRLVAWNASHDYGQQGIMESDLQKIINFLSMLGKVFISSEGLIHRDLEKYRIKVKPHRMHHVLHYAELYIGEGATMASECSVLGTPAIYINTITAGTLKEHELYGLMKIIKPHKNIFQEIKVCLNNGFCKERLLSNRNELLKDKIDVTSFMVWFVESFPESFKIMKKNPEYQNIFK
jgi:hypothetical protein